MELKASERERIIERMRQREITADQANVEMVRAQRVRLVTGKVPADVRRALSDAVRRGELGHIKKDGYKPEAFFHPTFAHLVAGERSKHERQRLEAMRCALSSALTRPDHFRDATEMVPPNAALRGADLTVSGNTETPGSASS